MQIPLSINFDYAPGKTQYSGVVRLPKIYQGAPYSQTVRVRSVGTGLYRDFSGYTDIRMQLRSSLNGPVLLSLSKTANQLIGGSTGLTIAFDATATDGLTAPNSTYGIVEVPFVYDIELITGSAVVERFAQGTGFIVMNVTR